MTEIFEQVLKEKDGVVISKIAILRNFDTDQLNEDLAKYCGNVPCNLFVDIQLNNPWVRVVISGIHELNYLTESQRLRLDKLNKINNL